MSAHPFYDNNISLGFVFQINFESYIFAWKSLSVFDLHLSEGKKPARRQETYDFPPKPCHYHICPPSND